MLIEAFDYKIFKDKNTSSDLIVSKILENEPDLTSGTVLKTAISDTFTKEQWFDIYKDNVEKFKNEMNLTGEIQFQTIWANVHKRHEKIERHNHKGYFVGLHYIKFNPAIHSSTIIRPDYESRQSYRPETNQDDVMIMSGDIFHETDANPSDDVRITVAFTFTLE